MDSNLRSGSVEFHIWAPVNLIPRIPYFLQLLFVRYPGRQENNIIKTTENKGAHKQHYIYAGDVQTNSSRETKYFHDFA